MAVGRHAIGGHENVQVAVVVGIADAGAVVWRIGLVSKSDHGLKLKDMLPWLTKTPPIRSTKDDLGQQVSVQVGGSVGHDVGKHSWRFGIESVGKNLLEVPCSVVSIGNRGAFHAACENVHVAVGIQIDCDDVSTDAWDLARVIDVYGQDWGGEPSLWLSSENRSIPSTGLSQQDGTGFDEVVPHRAAESSSSSGVSGQPMQKAKKAARGAGASRQRDWGESGFHDGFYSS